MFFKNKKFEVKMVDDNPNQTAMTPMLPKTDPLFELRMLVEENLPKVVIAAIAVKGASTIFSAIEHIVVTKIK